MTATETKHNLKPYHHTTTNSEHVHPNYLQHRFINCTLHHLTCPTNKNHTGIIEPQSPSPQDNKFTLIHYTFWYHLCCDGIIFNQILCVVHRVFDEQIISMGIVASSFIRRKVVWSIFVHGACWKIKHTVISLTLKMIWKEVLRIYCTQFHQQNIMQRTCLWVKGNHFMHLCYILWLKT